MVKRKAPSSDLPDTISLQPVVEPSTSGRPGPLALYFASGFEPSRDDACAWEVHTSTAHRNQHVVIARMVRACPFLQCVRSPATRVITSESCCKDLWCCLGQGNVDFVGTSQPQDAAGPPACRCMHACTCSAFPDKALKFARPLCESVPSHASSASQRLLIR